MEGPTPNSSSKRPCVQDQDDVRKSQRRRISSGDSLIETRSSTAESLGSDADKLKNTRRRRGDGCSKASIQSNSTSVPRHQPYGRQRTRQKLRQLVPAAPTPNSSVFENQQQEYERQTLLSSPFEKTIGRTDGIFAFSPQTPLPYNTGQQYSNRHPTYTLPMDPGRRETCQRYGTSYGNIPAESGDSRLSQARAVAGFNSAPAPPLAGFSQPLSAAGTYHQVNIYGNLATGQQGQRQGPSSLADVPHPGDSGPQLMGPPQSCQSTFTNVCPTIPSTGFSVRSAGQLNGVSPGSYYSQHQPLPMQFGMATVPAVGIGQPQQRNIHLVVPVSSSSGNYSGLAPPRSSQNNFRTGPQTQNQFSSPAPGQSHSSVQTQTSYMDFPEHLGIPIQYSAYADLQLPYPPPMSHNAGPPETQTAQTPIPGIPDGLPLRPSPNVPAAETSAQLLQQPSQQNAQDNGYLDFFEWDPVSPYPLNPVPIEQMRRLCLIEGTGRN